MSIREKIKDRLDELQSTMERQEHLSHPELVMEKLESVTKFTSILSEDERDFVTSARLALIKRITWEP